MKVLAIDDKEIDIKGIKDYCKNNKWDFQYNSFKDDYIQDLMKYDADVIVLDWFEDVSDDNDIGKTILAGFWENGYRPIVVFSAHADAITLTEEMQKSNLVKLYVKDAGGEEQLLTYLKENEVYFKALSDFRKDVGKVILSSFNAIEPLKSLEDGFIGNEIFKYILAKRMVSAFNVENCQKDMPSWGMYIYPPVSNTLTTGDILRKVGKNIDVDDARNYKVVISQACDIAHNKTKKILCLSCCTMKSGIINALQSELNHSLKAVPAMSDEEWKKAKKLIVQHKLCNAMNVGFYQKWAILPKLKGVCPDMSVDLKNVEPVDPKKISVSCDDLDEQEQEYYRVASLDPQYVTQLVWGYMQNACRPGAPDRNVEEWAKRVFS